MKKPCPYCGERFIMTPYGWIHPKREERNLPRCVNQGHTIGANHAHNFDMRGPVVWYQLVDGFPQFNTVGVGHPVQNAQELQSFFDYVKGAGHGK